MAVAVDHVLSGQAFYLGGKPVPSDMIGALEPARLSDNLQHTLDQRGYVLLRNLIDPDAVMAARHEILAALGSVGEITEPTANAVASGTSRRAELYPDPGSFWRGLSESAALRRVVHGPEIRSAMTRLFNAEVSPFDFVWLRAMAPGRASPMHMDHPYMNRGTDRLVTCWVPLGPVAPDEAPLYIMESAHKTGDLRARVAGLDVDRDKSRSGHFADDPIDLARDRGLRILTTAFNPGDVLIFGMFAIHASFDNSSQAGRVRLSCDTRWQPSSEPMDERFRGPDPPAHDGKGYGCLSAAQPLTVRPALR